MRATPQAPGRATFRRELILLGETGMGTWVGGMLVNATHWVSALQLSSNSMPSPWEEEDSNNSVHESTE